MNFASLTAVKKHIAWLKNKRGFLVRHGEIIVLGSLIAIVSVVNIVWIRQDTRPQPGTDPNGYLIKTYKFVDRLEAQGGAQFWQLVAGLSKGYGRPPLYQLLTAPFIYLFGRSADAALSVNVIFGAILLLCTYGIGRLARSGKAGLLAALLVATYPPIVNLSKIYRPHAATPACVALSLWLLLLLKTRSVRIAWLFGASLGFGMLIHSFFLFLLPAPTVLFGLYMLLFQTNPRYPPSLKGSPRWLLIKLRDPFVLYGLLPAALIAAGFTGSWYLTEGRALYAHYQEQVLVPGWSDITKGFPGVPHSFWWYALTMPGAISYVFAVLLGIGLVVGTIRRQLGPSVLVITFLAMYSGFVLRPGDLGWLHFAPVLPVAAVLTAVGVVDFRKKTSASSDFGELSRAVEPTRYSVRLAPQRRIGRLLSTTLTAVCVIVAAFNFSVVTWGVRPWSRPIAMALGAPLNSRTCLRRMNVAFCPNPARDEDWRVSDILRVILDDPECQERECHLVVVPKLDTLKYKVFDYHLVRDFPESRERLRVSRADWGYGGVPHNARWLISDYIVYIPQLVSGRRIRDALTQFLESSPAVFADAHQEVASFALPGGWTAKLIRRTEPPTLKEARLSIAALDLPEEAKSMMLRRVRNWLENEEN